MYLTNTCLQRRFENFTPQPPPDLTLEPMQQNGTVQRLQAGRLYWNELDMLKLGGKISRFYKSACLDPYQFAERWALGKMCALKVLSPDRGGEVIDRVIGGSDHRQGK